MGRASTDATLLRGLGAGPPVALVLGGATAQALGFIRSLGRRGIPTVALSVEARPWVSSRYCAHHAAAESEADLLDRLTRIGRRMARRAVILATGDRDVLFLSRNRDQLGGAYDFVVPPAATLELLSDKRSQYRFASDIGIPIPRTYCPTSPGDVSRIAEALRFPCVVKPADSLAWRQRRRDRPWRWAKAMEARTPDELRMIFAYMDARDVAPLIQERIAGDESRLYSVYAYFDRSSAPMAICAIQKRRQWPPGYGSGSYSVTCRQDRAVEQAVALLRRMGYQGVANVEFKQDPEDGELKLIEINPRCGERVGLAVAAGSDIPYVAYRDALGDPPLPGQTHAIGVTWINALNDCAAVLSHYRRAERLNWWRWVRSAVSAGSHAHFAMDDPVPCLENLLRTARREAAPFIRHLRGQLGAGSAGPGRPGARPTLDRGAGLHRGPGPDGRPAIPEVGPTETTGARAGR